VGKIPCLAILSNSADISFMSITIRRFRKLLVNVAIILILMLNDPLHGIADHPCTMSKNSIRGYVYPPLANPGFLILFLAIISPPPRIGGDDLDPKYYRTVQIILSCLFTICTASEMLSETSSKYC